MTTSTRKRRGRPPGIHTKKRPKLATDHIVYPVGVAAIYGVTKVTVVNWERNGDLPPRDAFHGAEPVGWLRETIDAFVRGKFRARNTEPATA